MGVLTESQAVLLSELYIEINSLNLGLNQINETRFNQHNSGKLAQEEAERNEIKAKNILTKHQDALGALRAIKEWIWWTTPQTAVWP
jgi:hypothetical protein